MTGRIPQSFIDDVLSRTDIVDLIDARVKLRKAGRNYMACCPFHQEKSPSFTVTRDKQFYYCFGCGVSGNAVSFLMDYDHVGFIDALKQLADRVGLTLPETERDTSPRESLDPVYQILDEAARYFEQQLRHSPQKDRAVRYFKGRGLSGEIARSFRLGYAPPGWDNLLGKLASSPERRELLLKTGLLVKNEQRQSVYDAMRDRVIFPIRDFRGRVIAFGGRVLNDDKPKYLNSPESPVFQKGQELYGFWEARQHTTKLTRIMVVEGYMDVVALAQFGITYAVATLGTSTSTTHITRLFRQVSEILFCFDGDAAGRRAAWRALESALPALEDGRRVSFLFLPEGEDPDSLVRREGPAHFEARLDQAEPLADFFYRHLSEGLNLAHMEDRARLAAEAKPLLAKLPEGVLNELMLAKLAELTQLERDTLRQTLAPVATPTTTAASTETAPQHYTAQHHTTQPDDADYGYDDGAWTPEPEPNRRRWRKGDRDRDRRDRPTRPSKPAPIVSLAEKAVCLLLRNPSDARRLDAALFTDIDLRGADLLKAQLNLLTEYPDLSTAALLGAWHGTEQGDALARLAASEFLLSSEGVEQELADGLLQLEKRVLEARMDSLQQQLNQDRNNLALASQLLALRRQLATLQQELTSDNTPS